MKKILAVAIVFALLNSGLCEAGKKPKPKKDTTKQQKAEKKNAKQANREEMRKKFESLEAKLVSIEEAINKVALPDVKDALIAIHVYLESMRDLQKKHHQHMKKYCKGKKEQKKQRTVEEKAEAEMSSLRPF